MPGGDPSNSGFYALPHDFALAEARHLCDVLYDLHSFVLYPGLYVGTEDWRPYRWLRSVCGLLHSAVYSSLTRASRSTVL